MHEAVCLWVTVISILLYDKWQFSPVLNHKDKNANMFEAMKLFRMSQIQAN